MVQDGDAPPSLPAPFRIANRWTSTSTNGSTGAQGTPITLRWSFLRDGVTVPDSDGPLQPDGSGSDVAAPSALISNFDARFGTSASLETRPWFRFFNDSFNRWAQLSGVTYAYEANDDSASFFTNGQVGVRGDIRIGAKPIDGASNTLAYNYFPNAGDMVLDTQETTAFNSTTNDYRSLRNIITHEAGHGLGFDHVESSNSGQLMEPFLSTSFDGPQLDDILAVQRNYGDAREKSGGNDNAANADSLGTFAGAGSASVGTATPDTITAIPLAATDFVSIDDESDVDLYSFTVAPGSIVTLTLDPSGYSYLEGPQNSVPSTDPNFVPQTTFDASLQSDLTLTLLGIDGTTVLDSSNLGGLGVTESLSETLLAGGTYFARIAGLTADRIQLYQLDFAVTVPEPTALAAVALLGLGLRRRRAA
ncbi:MAG TPA: matrixin family metalloprotease [Tepidisphaeraceae bacterium]